jgi:hypothetical protein
MLSGGYSLVNKYTLDPLKVYCGFWVVLGIVGVVGEVVGAGEGEFGEVDVLEGVVAFYEEVHVDVGVVVERLVALQA